MAIFAVRGNGESENRWKFGLACIYGIKGNINIELYEFWTMYFVTIFAYEIRRIQEWVSKFMYPLTHEYVLWNSYTIVGIS